MDQKFEAKPNVRLPGAEGPTGETIKGVEIPLPATPPGECNRFT